jgi:Fungal trichothecene efflux pump (TRI12)
MLRGVGVSGLAVFLSELPNRHHLANTLLFLAGFYVNLPIGGALAILLLLFKIPEPTTKLPPRQVLGTAIKSLDLPGFMLISPAAIMFLLGLQYGGTVHPWNSSVVIGLLVGAAVTFILFLVWEYHQGDGAMVPFAMIRKRIVWSAAGNLFFLLGAILVAEYYLAIYFQTVLDNRPIMSGVHLLPTTLGLVIFTMLSGIMSSLSPFLFCKLFKN